MLQRHWTTRRQVGAASAQRFASAALLQRLRHRCASSAHGDAAPATTVQATSPQRSSLPPLIPLDEKYEAYHTFTPYANWLIPGAVMLGRYPFVEPSRCRSREQGEMQVEQILQAGVTTFVCLQEELPSQEQLRLVGKNGFMPYKSTAELIQRALNEPPPSAVVNGLRNPQLNKFLPTKKRIEPAQEYNPKQLHFVHSPIVDLGVPCPETLKTLIQDLERRIMAGEVIYAHCWGGRGRAGTLGACLLAAVYGVGVEEALERVQRAFDTRRDDDRKSPETDEQYEFVRQFIAGLSSAQN